MEPNNSEAFQNYQRNVQGSAYKRFPAGACVGWYQMHDNTQKVYFSKMTQCNFAGCWSDSALCIYGLKTWACEATLSAVPAVNFASFSLSLDFCISPRLNSEDYRYSYSLVRSDNFSVSVTYTKGVLGVGYQYGQKAQETEFVQLEEDRWHSVAVSFERETVPKTVTVCVNGGKVQTIQLPDTHSPSNEQGPWHFNGRGFLSNFVLFNRPLTHEELKTTTECGTHERKLADFKLFFPLHFACRAGDYDSVVSLISSGHSSALKEWDSAGFTPLIQAVVAGAADIVKLLLQHGANPNQESYTGRHPIFFSTMESVTSILLNNGVSIEAQSSVSEYGASPITHVKAGDTALIWSARSCFTEVMKLLLQRGADSKHVNSEKETAFRATDVREFKEVIYLSEIEILRKKLLQSQITQHSEGGDGKVYDIFLSHKQTTASDLARVLHEELQQNRGFKCFLDREDANILHDLELNVKNSRIFLFIISKDVMKSYWCLKEIRSALVNGTPIVLLHDKESCSFPAKEEIPVDLRIVFQAKAIPYDRDFHPLALQYLLDRIAQLTAK